MFIHETLRRINFPPDLSQINPLQKVKDMLRDPRTGELAQKTNVMRECLGRMLGDSRNWSFNLHASQTEKLLGNHWNYAPAVVKIAETTKDFTLEITKLHEDWCTSDKLELAGGDPRVIRINDLGGRKSSYQIAPSYGSTREKIDILDRWIGIGIGLEALQKKVDPSMI